jgi:hypothetical protein|tara:strand:- start:1477 stop:2280 length:804 start_codon:yes stop_codon:yes gene_type:complete
VSNELKLEPCYGFESLQLDDIDNNILNGALNLNSGQSKYQSEVFVAHSQLTPYRMIKQCLLELEARHHSWFNIDNKLKKKRIEIQMAAREIDVEDDDLRCQMIAIDMEDMAHDIEVWERKKIQAEEEVHDYLRLAKKIAVDSGDEGIIEKAFGYDHEEERKYWITRMAKQAAMDMVSYGRIGSGNMDSIAMMPEEDQVLTLATTLQYNERLGQGMTEIGNAVSQGLLDNKEHLPRFDVPKVTDKLMMTELLDNVQHTTQSKTKSQSI